MSLNLKQVKGNFQRLFDKNLTDLVRGLRNNKDNEVMRPGQIAIANLFAPLFHSSVHISTFLNINSLCFLFAGELHRTVSRGDQARAAHR